jgi:hypothetical protein
VYHAKTIAASDEAAELLKMTDTAALLSGMPENTPTPWVFQGIVTVKGASDFRSFCMEFINKDQRLSHA